MLRAAGMRGKVVRVSEIPTTRTSTVHLPTDRVRDGGNGHVLVADGNTESRERRQAELRAAGFRVSVARTGFEAIVKATCQVPDLVLVDDTLPDLDASETGRLITTCPVTSHIPVVHVSASRKLPRRVFTELRRRAG